MQEIKRFVQGADTRGPSFITTNIEDQINEYLKENQNKSIRTFQVVLGPKYKEAFIVFDIREEKKPRPEIGFNKDISRKQKGTEKQKGE